MRGNARTDLRSNERARKGDEVANDNRLENTAHNAESVSDWRRSQDLVSSS